MSATNGFDNFATADGRVKLAGPGFRLLATAGLMLLAAAAFAAMADEDRVDGYVELDVGRVDLQSCVAYADGDRLVIGIEAFEFTEKDLQAYQKRGLYRDIALVDVDERHAVPSGYQRHPGIGIALIYDQAVSYETTGIVDSDVALYGTGTQGDMYSGLLPRHYDLKIVFLDEARVSGTLRSAGEGSRFEVDFECPVVHPAQ